MRLFQTIRSRAFMPIAVAAPLALWCGLAAAAATIVIINNDGAGEGFNDPTPVAPVGGNAGVTLGQQRLFVFQQGASIWGGILTSGVVIEVRAQFNPQTCTPTSAVLGSAGPVTIHRDFAGAPFAGTWYHQSLANKLAAVDLAPGAGTPDINATFNSQLDSGGCLGGLVWYYGFDGNEGVNIELLPVVIHELGHGLGFSTPTSGTTGAFNGGFPGVYDRFLLDNTSGLHWYQMATNAERVASAINTGNLVWDGAFTRSQASTYLTRPNRVLDNNTAANYTAVPATFGPQTFNLTGNIVDVDDGVAPITDGCTALVNGGAVAGKIALVDRGTCAFVVKAQMAQAAGAIGIIIINNIAGLPPNPMGGTDPTITIPVLGISLADGTTLRTELSGGPVSVTMGPDPAANLAGADAAGNPKMYTPNPFQGGSSVSHWDVSLTPNTLMEPFINTDLHDTVDLTLGHLQDIGWFPGATAVNATFLAQNRGDGVLLRWRFQDMSDVSVITVERARAAQGPFNPIRTELASDGEMTTALDTSAEPGVTYYYRLNVLDRQGQTQLFGPVTGRREGEVPTADFVRAPAPNPAQNQALVAFRIAKPEFVRLAVLDVNGRRVATLQEGMMVPGEYTRTWNVRSSHGGDVPPGMYFFALTTSEGTRTSRLAVVH
jgi:hypothetical protein